MIARAWCAVAALATAALAAPFSPPPTPDGGGAIGALWRRAVTSLEAASAARVPPLSPPTPRPVVWKPRRVTSIDLGAPLLALDATDVDGDGTDELVALTDRHLVVLAPHGRSLRERARIGLPSDPPVLRPRDPVGALSVTSGEGGVELWARTSSAARGGRYGWRDGALVEVAPLAGYPWCPDRVVELAAGRNYATEGGVDRWSGRCRLGEVDATGRAVAASAAVTVDGLLEVTIDTRCAGRDCPPPRTVTLAGVGAAFAIADVDRDGALEVLVSSASAPGDGDAVAVHTLEAGGFGKKPRFRRAFLGGVVGLAVGDVDGDGDREAFAAVRLAGARKVDLWLLD